jgi:hypothetical protein
VGGQGVSEVDVFGDVVCREPDLAAVVKVGDGQGPVLVGLFDSPHVAVLHDVAASLDLQLRVVGAGDDVVPGPCPGPVAQLHGRAGAGDFRGQMVPDETAISRPTGLKSG